MACIVGDSGAVSATSIAEERAVALTVLASLAKNAAREDLRGHLGDLVPVMLESLSGMEVGVEASSHASTVQSSSRNLEV